MQILPSIDLKDEKVVRLYKGDFATTHTVADSAVETARRFLDAGVELIHMVDLDGAKTGSSKNRDIVREVITVTGARVELGGGIRRVAGQGLIRDHTVRPPPGGIVPGLRFFFPEPGGRRNRS